MGIHSLPPSVVRPSESARPLSATELPARIDLPPVLRAGRPALLRPARLRRDPRATGIAALAREAIRRDIEPGERGHSARVAFLARAVAVQIDGVDPEAAYLSGFLHDVGKALLPWDPAMIRRRLTRSETRIMRTHAALGAHAAEQAGVSCEIAQSILSHHERIDGSGYPKGTRGRSVPVLSRIVAVADVYDALANARSYKAAWPIVRVQRYLSAQSGRSMSRDIVTAVLEVAASGFSPMDRRRTR